MSIGRTLQRYPRSLNLAYTATRALMFRLAPIFARIGYQRVDRWVRGPEEVLKGWVFDCQMCGQCVLHSTGMTCPMTCPKDLRNGPCGGVRQDGNCEVFAHMPCVWVQAVERGEKMVRDPGEVNELQVVQPPLDRSLAGTSAWINMLSGAADQTPAGWETRKGGGARS